MHSPFDAGGSSNLYVTLFFHCIIVTCYACITYPSLHYCDMLRMHNISLIALL